MKDAGLEDVKKDLQGLKNLNPMTQLKNEIWLASAAARTMTSTSILALRMKPPSHDEGRH